MTLRFGINSISPVRPLLKPEEVSDCILEIPQNIKLGLEDNVLTIKAGSVLTVTGSSYATATVTTDVSRTFGSAQDGRYMVFATGAAFSLSLPRALNNVYSGDSSSYPTEGIDSGTVYFNTTDKLLYYYDTDSSTWKTWDISYYPLCCLDCVDGAWSFAKDSNGNDMIFNSAGFIGKHIFCMPDVTYLCGNGIDANGNKLSLRNTVSSFTITQMNPTTNVGWFKGVIMRGNNNSNSGTAFCRYVKTKDEILPVGSRLQWVTDDNMAYVYSSSELQAQPRIYLLTYEYDGTTISDFVIRQPSVKTFYQEV